MGTLAEAFQCPSTWYSRRTLNESCLPYAVAYGRQLLFCVRQLYAHQITLGIRVLVLLQVFPRLFVCTSVDTPSFRVEFELALVILFDNDRIVKETFPLSLHRW